MTRAPVTRAIVGELSGEVVEMFTLWDGMAVEVSIMTYGAALTAIQTPDRDGTVSNVILGFDSLNPYLTDEAYLGAIVGRYANRIAHGRFAIDGTPYQISLNDGPNSLHGGKSGFDKRIWQVRSVPAGSAELRLRLVSPDGDQGYPGELTVDVIYRLSGHCLSIDFTATTTAPTPVNLASHAYFNLTGIAHRPIDDHTLIINAEEFTPVDTDLIPTGQRQSVADTPFDFRTPQVIGERIHVEDAQLRVGKGYDHNWVLLRQGFRGLQNAALLSDPESGRTLELQTTQPGLQFYSGNFLNGGTKEHPTFGFRTGLCLETQHFPDSPNQAAFPSAVLRPGEAYHERTVLRFGINARR